MKKCLILAAAALVAFAACTKVETVEAPAQRISFQVAKYANQTKADPIKGSETSLLSEKDANGNITSFKTNAWYHSPADGTQYFMKNIDITWNTNIANQWAPAVDYFWPKTGTINFYSYAGTPAPSAYGNTAATEGTLTYANRAIAYNDNVLVADAAYRYNQNKEVYQLDNATTGKGVPTLFRHYLAKLAFNVVLRTTDEKKTATNHFRVEILDAHILVSNKGTLTLTNTDPGNATAEINPWTNANTAHANVAWEAAAWNVTSGSETVENIHMDTTSSYVASRDMIKKMLNLAENAVKQTESDTALLEMRSVMPQVLTDNHEFYIKYRVFAYHTGEDEPYSIETLEFRNPITSFVSAITEWDKNTMYTYNVLIDPIASKILFDPAVEAWDKEEQNFNPWLN